MHICTWYIKQKCTCYKQLISFSIDVQCKCEFKNKSIILIIITKIYIADMPDSSINRQIESEANKQVDLTNV